MPREPIPLIRKGGFLEAEKMFVLSYEGTETEKKYFEDFRRSDLFNDGGLIETISLKRPHNHGSHPISVKKLLQEAKRDYRFGDTDGFWLIIDRDQWEQIHHYDFDKLVMDCKMEKNFFLAMSNPCFEVWLLLHLVDIHALPEDEKQKIFVNEKINKRKNYIDVLLGEYIGRGYNKRANPDIFLPQTKVAITRAIMMDDGLQDYPKYLGSHVYKLIQKLMKSSVSKPPKDV